MIKHLAILGLLALTCGAWSQVPGDGSKQHNKAQDKQETTNPPKPVVVVESNHSANNQQQAAKESSGYPWKELLAPANVPNWFLVVVGGVTGWFVYKTLRAIKKQADIMETQAKDARESGAEATRIALATAQAARKAADAAEISARAAMGVAVPTLVLIGFDFAEMGAVSFEAQLQNPKMRVVVKNYGQTPAFLKSYGLEYSCDGIKSTATRNPYHFEEGTVIETGREFILQDVVFTPWEPFSTEDVAGIVGKNKILGVAGCLRYGDVFGSPIRELRFCEELADFRPGGTGPMWVECNLGEKYRLSTEEQRQEPT